MTNKTTKLLSSSRPWVVLGRWSLLATLFGLLGSPAPASAGLRKGQVLRALERLKQPNWRSRWRSLQLLAMVSPKQRHTPWSRLASAVAGRLADQHPMVRAAAASALRVYGPRGVTALPALSKAVADSNQMVGLQAAFAIGAIGPKAWPVALRLSQAPNAKVQRRITMALSAFGKRAIPILAGQLKKTDARLKLYALQALVKLAHFPESKQTLSALMAGIQGKQHELRQWSLRVLQRMGVHAKAAVPTLRKLLKQGAPSTQKAAVIALGKIGPGAISALPRLQQLAAANGPLQCDAIEAIGAFGKSAAAAVPLLTALLKPSARQPGKQPCVPQATLQAIGRMGSAAKSAAHPVLGYLRHPDPQIVREAIGAITQISPPPQAAVKGLASLLSSPHLALQTAAIKAMAAFPRAAASVAVQLGELLKQRGDQRQSYAVTERQDAILEVLRKLGKDAVVAYAAGLSSPSLHVRQTSINALCQMASHAGHVTAAIIQATEDKDHQVRFRAVEAISLIGPSTGNAGKRALLRALKDKHHWVRYYALRSLQTLHLVGALGAIKPLLKDKSPFVQRQAAATWKALRAQRARAASRPAASQPTTRPTSRPSRRKQ